MCTRVAYVGVCVPGLVCVYVRELDCARYSACEFSNLSTVYQSHHNEVTILTCCAISVLILSGVVTPDSRDCTRRTIYLLNYVRHLFVVHISQKHLSGSYTRTPRALGTFSATAPGLLKQQGNNQKTTRDSKIANIVNQSRRCSFPIPTVTLAIHPTTACPVGARSFTITEGTSKNSLRAAYRPSRQRWTIRAGQGNAISISIRGTTLSLSPKNEAKRKEKGKKRRKGRKQTKKWHCHRKPCLSRNLSRHRVFLFSVRYLVFVVSLDILQLLPRTRRHVIRLGKYGSVVPALGGAGEKEEGSQK